MAAAKSNGRKGGLATAAKYSHEQRVAWGEKAGGETLRRYGADYFRYIRTLRKDRKPKKRKTS